MPEEILKRPGAVKSLLKKNAKTFLSLVAAGYPQLSKSLLYKITYPKRSI